MKNTFFLNPMFLNEPTLIESTLKMKYLSLLILAFVIYGAISPAECQAGINTYETKVINKQITASFHLLIDNWNEELYFDMYDFGQRNSKKQLTRAEFAQRMVDLKWKPTLKKVKISRIKILYRNYAVIYFIQEFENKVNAAQRIEKEMIFPTLLEKKDWKFDLTQLINIPYEGKFLKEVIKEKEVAKPKEEEKTEKKEQTP